MQTSDGVHGPGGACAGCGGRLVWSRLRYEPAGWGADGRRAASWTGTDAVCAGALSSATHPCRVAAAAAAATTDSPAVATAVRAEPIEAAEATTDAVLEHADAGMRSAR